MEPIIVYYKRGNSTKYETFNPGVVNTTGGSSPNTTAYDEWRKIRDQKNAEWGYTEIPKLEFDGIQAWYAENPGVRRFGRASSQDAQNILASMNDFVTKYQNAPPAEETGQITPEERDAYILKYKQQAYTDWKAGASPEEIKQYDKGAPTAESLKLPTATEASESASPYTAGDTKLPSGVLVRDSSDNKIYFIDNGVKRHVTNEEALAGGAFVDIDPSHLADVPEGPAIETKTSFAWKGQEEVNKLMEGTGINWQEARGYDANAGTTDTSNTEVKTGDGSSGMFLPKLPDELNQKLYQATGRIAPTDEDVTNWQYNPQIFEQQLDDMISQSQQQMTDEQKAADDEVAAQKWDQQVADAPNTNYVRGDYALVKFQSDPTPNDATDDTNTIWLYDKQKQTYRPFTSIESLKAAFGEDYDKAMSNLVSLPVTALNNPQWASAEFIPRDYGIQDDGTVTRSPNEINAGLQSIYGQKKVAPDVEEAVANIISMAFTTAKRSGGISEETFNKYLASEDGALAKYVNASLYGGYSFDALFRDLKAKELRDQGDPAYENYKGFDDTLPSSQWMNSPEGKASITDAKLSPPDDFWGMDEALFNNSIFKVPGSAFQTLVPPIDIDSPEFKEEAEEIQASYFDILMQKAEAQTEQAKAVADNNWEQFKEDIQRRFDIQLSNNANGAWGQIQNLIKGASEAGLGQSGLLEEALDKHLYDVRKGDQINREDKITSEERTRVNNLLQNGTPTEIAAFVAENQELAKASGLIPSDEVLAFYNKDNLKEKYPDMSDEEIDKIVGMMVDENGNYRSQMYQNLFANQYDLGKQKTAYQESKLYQQKLDEEDKAYAPYTTGNPLSSYQPNGEDTAATGSTATTGGINDWSSYQAWKESNPDSSLAQQNSTADTSYTAATDDKQAPTTDSQFNIQPDLPATDTYWEKFKTDSTASGATQDWSQYSAITAGQNDQYDDIQNPGGSTLYGKKKTSLY